MTNLELARYWGINEATFYRWRTLGAPLATADDDAMFVWCKAQRQRVPKGLRRAMSERSRARKAALAPGRPAPAPLPAPALDSPEEQAHCQHLADCAAALADDLQERSRAPGLCAAFQQLFGEWAKSLDAMSFYYGSQAQQNLTPAQPEADVEP